MLLQGLITGNTLKIIATSYEMLTGVSVSDEVEDDGPLG